MKFSPALVEAILLRRYKRFLADVAFPDGRVVTVHTANTGSMAGCAEPGSRVWLSRSSNPRRKYPMSWEIVEVQGGTLVGINTARSNDLVAEAIGDGTVRELQGYGPPRREVPYGLERSRIDLLLRADGSADCYVEVKNVTLTHGDVALFPDAVSARGTRHLRELAAMVREGCRAVILFCVQRADVVAFRPAQHIDPVYARGLAQAAASGVEALAYAADVSPREIRLVRPLEVRIR